MKGKSQNWFDAEIMEKTSDRVSVSIQNKSGLHVDKDSYKEVRNEVQKLISTKRKLTLTVN